MKLLATLSALLASAIAADQTSMLSIRLHSTISTHYESSQQIPTSSKGTLLHVAVGTNLSFDHAPLHIQGIEIASIHEGMDLSNPPRFVEEDSDKVVCKAQVGWSSEGVEFKMNRGVVALRQGDMENVTGLSCWLA
ncbi:hypothetical protein DM02DRAFT_653649 [Periconia macrospinosa]|uniref:Uncharacterized protein n=1 Tax=Periconia macrospinosa TaxID=97972 RepID=A0A2V1DW54_9PLEO|nr:hypothetical protein DM02DRAFT_653649 [Periconia macrospinosa]